MSFTLGRLTTTFLSLGAFALFACAGAAPAAAQGAPAAGTASDASSPAPKTVDPAARAQSLFAQVQAGKIDRTQLTTDFSDELTDEILAAMSGSIRGYGKPDRFVLIQKTDVEGDTRYVFRVVWKEGDSVFMTFGVDDDSGKISALYFRPGAYTP